MRLTNCTLAVLVIPTTVLLADSLSLGSANGTGGETITLPFSFTNTHEIVGMQFDLMFPEAQVEAGSAVTTVAGLTAESREVAAGQRRVVLFSPVNALLPGSQLLDVPLSLKPGSPEGGPTVRLQNIVFTDKAGRKYAPSVKYAELDAWRLSHFTDAERNEAAVIGDHRDPDADGLPNLVEFLTGSDPKAKQSGSALAPQMSSGPDGKPEALSITFNAAKDATTASLAVETSTDLQTWTRSGYSLTPTGVSTAQTVELKATVPLSGAAKRFFRLTGARTPAGISFFSSSGEQQNLAVNYDAYGEWKQARFTAAQLADPAVSGDAADPDADGITNVIEFYTGTDPRARTSANRPEVSIEPGPGGSQKLVMTFRAARGPLNGSLAVQASSDLLSWENSALQLVPTGAGDATSIELRAEVPVSDNSKFLRLRTGEP